MTLVEFLTARLDEDEAAAMAQPPWPWRIDPHLCDEETVVAADNIPVTEAFALSGPQTRAVAAHIVRYDPERALAEVEAKRAILHWHESWPVLAEQTPPMDAVWSGDIGSTTLKMSRQIAWLTTQEYRARFGDEPPTTPILTALASIYADHPDYDPAWAAPV